MDNEHQLASFTKCSRLDVLPHGNGAVRLLVRVPVALDRSQNAAKCKIATDWRKLKQALHIRWVTLQLRSRLERMLRVVQAIATANRQIWNRERTALISRQSSGFADSRW